MSPEIVAKTELQTESMRWYEVEHLIAGLAASSPVKHLCLLIHLHTNHRKQVAWKSQKNLADEMGASERTVRAAFSEAKRLGIVGIRRIQTGKHRDDQYNEYWLEVEGLLRNQRE